MAWARPTACVSERTRSSPFSNSTGTVSPAASPSSRRTGAGMMSLPPSMILTRCAVMSTVLSRAPLPEVMPVSLQRAAGLAVRSPGWSAAQRPAGRGHGPPARRRARRGAGPLTGLDGDAWRSHKQERRDGGERAPARRSPRNGQRIIAAHAARGLLPSDLRPAFRWCRDPAAAGQGRGRRSGRWSSRAMMGGDEDPERRRTRPAPGKRGRAVQADPCPCPASCAKDRTPHGPRRARAARVEAGCRLGRESGPGAPRCARLPVRPCQGPGRGFERPQSALGLSLSPAGFLKPGPSKRAGRASMPNL